MNKLETSAPSTRDNYQVVTRGKDVPTDRSPKPSVLLNESDPASVFAEIRVTPTEHNAVFNIEDDMMRDPSVNVKTSEDKAECEVIPQYQDIPNTDEVIPLSSYYY